jgi:hypothetical protein
MPFPTPSPDDVGVDALWLTVCAAPAWLFRSRGSASTGAGARTSLSGGRRHGCRRGSPCALRAGPPDFPAAGGLRPAEEGRHDGLGMPGPDEHLELVTVRPSDAACGVGGLGTTVLPTVLPPKRCWKGAAVCGSRFEVRVLN